MVRFAGSGYTRVPPAPWTSRHSPVVVPSDAANEHVWNGGQLILLFVIDFKIGLHFVDLGGPGGPGGPNLPSSLWGASRPTLWKVDLARRGRRDPQNRRN